MTPARSEILLQTDMSASTNLYIDRAAGELLLPRRWGGIIWPLIMKAQLGAVFLKLQAFVIKHQNSAQSQTTWKVLPDRIFFTFYRRAFPVLNILLQAIPPTLGCWTIWLEITHETTICCVKERSKNTRWLDNGAIFHAEVSLWRLIIHIYWPLCSSAGAKTFLNPQSHRWEQLVFKTRLESVGVLHRRYGT